MLKKNIIRTACICMLVIISAIFTLSVSVSAEELLSEKNTFKNTQKFEIDDKMKVINCSAGSSIVSNSVYFDKGESIHVQFMISDTNSETLAQASADEFDLGIITPNGDYKYLHINSSDKDKVFKAEQDGIYKIAFRNNSDRNIEFWYSFQKISMLGIVKYIPKFLALMAIFILPSAIYLSLCRKNPRSRWYDPDIACCKRVIGPLTTGDIALAVNFIVYNLIALLVFVKINDFVNIKLGIFAVAYIALYIVSELLAKAFIKKVLV